MTDTILIPPGPLVRFVESTALAGCTTTRLTDDGLYAVARMWPALSSGEEVLWRLLSSFAHGDLAAAVDRLDDRNLAALADTITRLVAPVIAQAAEVRGVFEPGRCSCGADNCSDAGVLG